MNGPGYFLKGELKYDQSAQRANKQITDSQIWKLSLQSCARLNAPPVMAMLKCQNAVPSA